MRRLPLIATLLAVALATAVLSVGTAFAVTTATDVGTHAAVVAQEEPAEEPVEEPATEAEGERPVLPLDIETPYGAFGAFLILSLVAAGGLALRNAMQQLKGERPQADGSWRSR